MKREAIALGAVTVAAPASSAATVTAPRAIASRFMPASQRPKLCSRRTSGRGLGSGGPGRKGKRPPAAGRRPSTAVLNATVGNYSGRRDIRGA